MFRDSMAPLRPSERSPVRWGQWLTAGYIQVFFTQLPSFAMWKIGKDLAECWGSVFFLTTGHVLKVALISCVIWSCSKHLCVCCGRPGAKNQGESSKDLGLLFLSHAKLCEYWTDSRAVGNKYTFKESCWPFKGKRKMQYKITLPSPVIESVSIKKTYIISGSPLLYIKRLGAMQSLIGIETPTGGRECSV